MSGNVRAAFCRRSGFLCLLRQNSLLREETIQLRILHCLIYGEVRGVHTGDFSCTCQSCVQAE